MIQQEGPGWRLARDPSRGSFPVLLGAEHWAIELTEEEWVSLVVLVDDLVEQYKNQESQLMPEEALCLEIERKPWWACLDGDRNAWSLQLVLEGDGRSRRGVEAFWPIPAAEAITAAMRTIWDSYQ